MRQLERPWIANAVDMHSELPILMLLYDTMVIFVANLVQLHQHTIDMENICCRQYTPYFRLYRVYHALKKSL